MSQDYKRKYLEQVTLSKKQQQTIKKLQQEIRERCHSYLLHASKNKKSGDVQFQDIAKVNRREENVDVKEFNTPEKMEREGSLEVIGSKIFSDNGSVSQSKVEENLWNEGMYIEKKRLRLACSKQIQIMEELKGEPKVDESIGIIQSFKERIAVLQKSKNEVVKDLQKSEALFKETKNKSDAQQIELQKIKKSQKKLKNKLERMPEYQNSINQIYYKLMAKVKGVQESEEGENMEIQKHINKKIQEILLWISESMNKVDNILENINTNNEIESAQKIEQTNQNNFEINQESSIVKPLFGTEEKQWSNVDVPAWTISSKNNHTITKAFQINQFTEKNDRAQQEDRSLIRQLEQHSYTLEKELTHVKCQFQKVKEQLNRSRILTPEVDQQKLMKQINTLKDQLQKNKKMSQSQIVDSNTVSIEQQLEPPYYVEEDLQLEGNSQYVKRSFVRKKIVRRNLSATTYRVVNKSKQELQSLLQSKVAQYADKSVEKAKKITQRLTKQQKMQALKNSIKDNRVSQMSRQSDSRNSGNQFEQIRVVELKTTTPSEQITSTKIYSQSGQSNVSFRRKL